MAEVKDMEREELNAHMKAHRVLREFDEDRPEWQRAIELYKQQTGMKFDPDCTGCRKRLVEWLERV